MMSLKKLNLKKDLLITINDFNLNEIMRNLVLNHVNLMIFQRNYFSRMIHYDSQAIYRDIASRKDLIIAFY